MSSIKITNPYNETFITFGKKTPPDLFGHMIWHIKRQTDVILQLAAGQSVSSGDVR